MAAAEGSVRGVPEEKVVPQLDHLKHQLKSWEKSFFRRNGFKPRKYDIDVAGDEVKSIYKNYWALVKSQPKVADPQPSESRRPPEPEATVDSTLSVDSSGVWGTDLNKKPLNEANKGRTSMRFSGASKPFIEKLMKHFLSDKQSVVRKSYSLKRKPKTGDEEEVEYLSLFSRLNKENARKREEEGNGVEETREEGADGSEGYNSINIPTAYEIEEKQSAAAEARKVKRRKYDTCFKCKQKGHWSTDCTATPPPVVTSKGKSASPPNISQPVTKVDPSTILSSLTNPSTPAASNPDLCLFDEDFGEEGPASGDKLTVNEFTEDIEMPLFATKEVTLDVAPAEAENQPPTKKRKPGRKPAKKDNFIRLDLKRKCFASKGYKKFNVQKYKRKKWRNNQKAKYDHCFSCKEKGHWAADCPQNAPDPGAEQEAVSGTEQVADPVTEQEAVLGAELEAYLGTEQEADPGTEEVVATSNGDVEGPDAVLDLEEVSLEINDMVRVEDEMAGIGEEVGAQSGEGTMVLEVEVVQGMGEVVETNHMPGEDVSFVNIELTD